MKNMQALIGAQVLNYLRPSLDSAYMGGVWTFWVSSSAAQALSCGACPAPAIVTWEWVIRLVHTDIIHLYMYVHTYIHIYIYISTYLSIYLYLDLSLYICTYGCINTNLFPAAGISERQALRSKPLVDPMIEMIGTWLWPVFRLFVYPFTRAVGKAA